MVVIPAESERRRLAAIDKIRGVPSAAAVERLVTAAAMQSVTMTAAEAVLDNLKRRMDGLIARQGREAEAERERMAARLGRPFHGVAA
jgi:hypothetical protein